MRVPESKLSVLLAFLSVSAAASASPVVTSALSASLDTGSLTGVTFSVSFSYDAGQIQSAGDSFITLNSFNFVLLGIPFDRSEIFQGGQVIFRNGAFSNVTASYQVFLPPGAPVQNITFGFGGPGIIGYIDLNRQFGLGSFSLTTAPEPSTLSMFGMALLTGGLCFAFAPLSFRRWPPCFRCP